MVTKTSKAKPSAKSKVVPIRTKGKLAPKVGHVSVRPSLDISDTPFFYANYMEVGHSNHEFTIFTARIPSKLSDEQRRVASQAGSLGLPAELQISIPPGVAVGLIKALQTQVDTYEKEHGLIGQEKKDD